MFDGSSSTRAHTLDRTHALHHLTPLESAPSSVRSDGVVDLKELEAGLKPKTRRKIEAKLDEGWKFDEAGWQASVARHNRWDMAKVFKQFDTDGDGKLDLYEARAHPNSALSVAPEERAHEMLRRCTRCTHGCLISG